MSLLSSTIIIENTSPIVGAYLWGGLIIGAGVIALVVAVIAFFISLEYEDSVKGAIITGVIALVVLISGGFMNFHQSNVEKSFEASLIEAVNDKYGINIVDTHDLYLAVVHNGIAPITYVNDGKFYDENVQITTIKKPSDKGTEYNINLFVLETEKNDSGYTTAVQGGKAESFTPCDAESCNDGKRTFK